MGKVEGVDPRGAKLLRLERDGEGGVVAAVGTSFGGLSKVGYCKLPEEGEGDDSPPPKSHASCGIIPSPEPNL